MPARSIIQPIITHRSIDRSLNHVPPVTAKEQMQAMFLGTNSMNFIVSLWEFKKYWHGINNWLAKWHENGFARTILLRSRRLPTEFVQTRKGSSESWELESQHLKKASIEKVNSLFQKCRRDPHEYGKPIKF